MNGLIFLATEEVASGYAFNWCAFVVIFVITALFMLFLGWINDILTEVIFYIGMCVFGAIAGILAGLVAASPTEYETRYKAAIASDVSITEFCKNYEIIEQEGLILTVKENKND